MYVQGPLELVYEKKTSIYNKGEYKKFFFNRYFSKSKKSQDIYQHHLINLLFFSSLSLSLERDRIIMSLV